MGKEIEKKDSLEYINVLRILALVLVILAHSSAVYTRYFQTFRMPLFVFISGYLYHFNRVKLNKYNSFPGFVRNKAKRLLIPYSMILMKSGKRKLWINCQIWIIQISL